MKINENENERKVLNLISLPNNIGFWAQIQCSGDRFDDNVVDGKLDSFVFKLLSKIHNSTNLAINRAISMGYSGLKK